MRLQRALQKVAAFTAGLVVYALCAALSLAVVVAVAYAARFGWEAAR